MYRKNVIKTADSNKEILLLLTDPEIIMYHQDFKKKAFEYFEENQMSNGSDFNSGIMNQLSEVRALKLLSKFIFLATLFSVAGY